MVASIWLTPELNQTKMVYVIGRHYCQKLDSAGLANSLQPTIRFHLAEMSYQQEMVVSLP